MKSIELINEILKSRGVKSITEETVKDFSDMQQSESIDNWTEDECRNMAYCYQGEFDNSFMQQTWRNERN